VGLLGLLRFIVGGTATIGTLIAEWIVSSALTHVHYSIYLLTIVIGLIVSAIYSQMEEA
jgi:hypothetical protein